MIPTASPQKHHDLLELSVLVVQGRLEDLALQWLQPRLRITTRLTASGMDLRTCPQFTPAASTPHPSVVSLSWTVGRPFHVLGSLAEVTAQKAFNELELQARVILPLARVLLT